MKMFCYHGVAVVIEYHQPGISVYISLSLHVHRGREWKEISQVYPVTPLSLFGVSFPRCPMTKCRISHPFIRSGCTVGHPAGSQSPDPPTHPRPCGRMDGWVGGWVGGWMDWWVHGSTCEYHFWKFCPVSLLPAEMVSEPYARNSGLWAC